jgi:hypothetical protein
MMVCKSCGKETDQWVDRFGIGSEKFPRCLECYPRIPSYKDKDDETK